MCGTQWELQNQGGSQGRDFQSGFSYCVQSSVPCSVPYVLFSATLCAMLYKMPFTMLYVVFCHVGCMLFYSVPCFMLFCVPWHVCVVYSLPCPMPSCMYAMLTAKRLIVSKRFACSILIQTGSIQTEFGRTFLLRNGQGNLKQFVKDVEVTQTGQITVKGSKLEYLHVL